MRRGHLWRSRWAAIGAAVAVTMGAGGLFAATAAGPPSNFVSVTPTRILDTRINAGLTGRLTSEVPRLLNVVGSIPTVTSAGTIANANVIPAGATAIVMNVTAVSPTASGFVSVRPGNAVGAPTTSNINLTGAGGVVPNSVTVEVPAGGNLNLYYKGTASGATTHLLIDVVGYYLGSDTRYYTKAQIDDAVDDTLRTETYGILDFQWENPGAVTAVDNNGCLENSTSTGIYGRIPLRIPVGSRLIRATVSVVDGSATTIYSIELARKTTHSIGSLKTSLAPPITLGSSTLGQLVTTTVTPTALEFVASNSDYYLRIGSFQNSVNRFCQASVTYDTTP